MSDFNVVAKATIGGVDYSGSTVANVSITSGRTDIYSQPVAGYVSLELLNLDNNPKPIQINQGITIQVKDSSGDWVSIAGANITDLLSFVKNAGSVTNVTSYQLTGLGALARLPKATTEGVLTSQLEGVQIQTILEELLAGQWNEVPAAETWATFDPTTTWANAENLGLGTIDAGQYELIARSSSVIDIYSLVAYLASSGFGYLYEDSEGRINYADSLHRQNYLAANGYVSISANQTSFRSLRSSKLSGDVRNKVTLKYGNNAASSVEATELDSINLYGQKEYTVTTALKHSTDAEDQADRYLSLRAYPREKMDSVTYDLTNQEIDDATRDALLNIFMGMPLRITDLPQSISGGEFTGFVEGWTWSVGYNRLTLTVNLSPTEFSVVALRWNQVAPTEEWDTISNTITWENALGTVA
jgi:hypothetical protein